MDSFRSVLPIEFKHLELRIKSTEYSEIIHMIKEPPKWKMIGYYSESRFLLEQYPRQ